jgi:predicted enzyme related to lactoylglutathione lyase
LTPCHAGPTIGVLIDRQETRMEVFQTHGAFSWNELMTSDPDAAMSFYKSLLGWTTETMDMGSGPYHVIKVGDASIGGIMKTPPEAGPMPPAWGGYVTVDNVDALVAKVPGLGGKVFVAPTDIPGVGRFSVIADPQGSVLNLITYNAPAAP